MAQPQAGYWTLPIIASYLSEVNPANNPYQERIDHLWSNILNHYFPLRDGFGTEREALVKPQRRFATNVAITNVRPLGMHKVVLVEAKTFPRNTDIGWFSVYPWADVESILQSFMKKAPDTFGNVQTMYGIVAVGDRVRFYTMNSQNNTGGILTPFPVGGPQPLLSVHTDAHSIHAILTAISLEIRTGWNTY
ncbi:hypothetical protein V8F44DRAFT_656079 [Aspergillus fumigatus]